MCRFPSLRRLLSMISLTGRRISSWKPPAARIVSTETLETIADKTLSSGKMRGLLDIASVGKRTPRFSQYGRADTQGGCFRAVPRRQRPPRDGAWPCAAAFGRPRADGRGFPAEAMRAAEKSTSAEPEAPAASLASEARDAKAARTELDSQSEIKGCPDTRGKGRWLPVTKPFHGQKGGHL